MSDAELAFGITSGRVRDGLPRLGIRLEQLGYSELWANDTRGGSGLSTLAAAASQAPRLGLGVGVMALSEHEPASIAEAVRASGLDISRLTVGVGSGGSRSLRLVREGVLELRDRLPETAIGMAAVGPRMTRLAGEVADAVIFGWAGPRRLAAARERVTAGAEATGRSVPRLVAYVRTALGPGAEARLRAETARYAGYGPHYAHAIAEQAAAGERLLGIALDDPTPGALAEALAGYGSVVDTVVVRALPARDADVEGWLEIAEQAASAA